MTTKKPKRGQLKLPAIAERQRFPDRNLHRGGRSFYFFDLDDNVMFLPTQIYIFEKGTRREVALSTGRFAEIASLIGKPGPYERYEVDPDDERGSFRRFRDLPVERLGGERQSFVEDIDAALQLLDVQWQGPSWDFFEHAVHNARPVSIITARGHHPRTLELGLARLYEESHLSRAPNYLGIYPVSHKATRVALGDAAGKLSIAALKHAAIVRSVEEAMAQYGASEFHRFGVSDDSQENLAIAVDAFTQLKRRFKQNAFFVFDASVDPLVRIEIDESGPHEEKTTRAEQLALFDAPE